MASLAGLEGIALPSFSSEMPARALRNYLYQLTEQLNYVLTNIDRENCSEEFLERMNGEGA